MSKLMKKSALVAALLGMMYHIPIGGCAGGPWRWVWAILQEDIFG